MMYANFLTKQATARAKLVGRRSSDSKWTNQLKQAVVRLLNKHITTLGNDTGFANGAKPSQPAQQHLSFVRPAPRVTRIRVEEIRSTAGYALYLYAHRLIACMWRVRGLQQ